MSNQKYSQILQNMERLKVLRDLALLDAPEEPFFDNLTKIASRVIGVPVSLVSLVAANYQFFKSSVGLPEPWNSNRRTPLSHSFCQHVVATNEPLVIDDARNHDLVKNNKAVPDLNVIGYLGMPLRTSSGQQLGSFCVIDSKPRTWTEEEIAVMREFAAIINQEIDARVHAKAHGRLDEHIAQARQDILALMRDIDSSTPKAVVITRLQRFQRDVQGA